MLSKETVHLGSFFSSFWTSHEGRNVCHTVHLTERHGGFLCLIDPHRTYNQGQSSYLDSKALWCLVLAASWKPTPAHYPGLFLSVEHRRPVLTSRPLHWLLLWSSPNSFFPSQLRCQLLREASPPVYRDWGAYRSTTVIHKMHISLNMLLKAPWVLVIGNFFSQFTVVRESVWH